MQTSQEHGAESSGAPDGVRNRSGGREVGGAPASGSDEVVDLRHTTANDAWDQPLWETFICTALGLEVPVLASLPRRNQRSPALCGCKKHGMDLYGDHT